MRKSDSANNKFKVKVWFFEIECEEKYFFHTFYMP